MGNLATTTHPAPRRFAFAAAVLSTWCAFAYAQAPVHKHYDAPEHATKPSASGALAPRLQNVGKHTFSTTCSSDQAQLFMNQGLNLTYGFNHAEAGRAFADRAERPARAGE